MVYCILKNKQAKILFRIKNIFILKFYITKLHIIKTKRHNIL